METFAYHLLGTALFVFGTWRQAKLLVNLQDTRRMHSLLLFHQTIAKLSLALVIAPSSFGIPSASARWLLRMHTLIGSLVFDFLQICKIQSLCLLAGTRLSRFTLFLTSRQWPLLLDTLATLTQSQSLLMAHFVLLVARMALQTFGTLTRERGYIPLRQKVQSSMHFASHQISIGFALQHLKTLLFGIWSQRILCANSSLKKKRHAATRRLSPSLHACPGQWMEPLSMLVTPMA